jgi:hypothetical protein
MLGPRHEAQACLQQIWTWLVIMCSMGSMSSELECENREVCCTRLETICRVCFRACTGDMFHEYR